MAPKGRHDRNELLNRSVLRPCPFDGAGNSQIAYRLGTPKAIDKNQTGSGLIHPIVKERVIPGQLEGLQTNPNPTEARHSCQRFFAFEIHSIFTPCEFPPSTDSYFSVLQRFNNRSVSGSFERRFLRGKISGMMAVRLSGNTLFWSQRQWHWHVNFAAKSRVLAIPSATRTT